VVTVSFDPKSHKTEIHIEGDPRWQVPATCPECGAQVDQSTAAFAAHPACTYCAKPFPCEPAVTEDY
jgi:hypothetical protein